MKIVQKKYFETYAFVEYSDGSIQIGFENGNSIDLSPEMRKNLQKFLNRRIKS